jgi:hypothetical protein
MGIRLRLAGDTLAPQSWEFGDGVERVTVGRDGERCDVALPAEMTAVGRQHVGLRQELGRWRVVVNRDNAVYLGDRRLDDGEMLPAEGSLRLGPQGPSLAFHATVPGSTATDLADGPAKGVHTRLREATKATGRHRLYLGLGAVGLAAVGLVLYLLSQRTGRLEEQWTSVVGNVPAAIGDPTRLATLFREEASTLRSFDAEAGRAAAPAVPDGNLDSAKALAASERMKESASFAKVLRDAAPSVLLVVRKHADGVVTPAATAWVVGEDLVATNGHVAEFVARDGGNVYVRTPGRAPKDYRVVATENHPGYVASQRIWSQHRPGTIEGDTPKAVNRPPAACDVALLRVDRAKDGSPLPPPLRVADSATLQALRPGTPVAFVGYPMEDMSVGGVNLDAPVAQAQVATVTALTGIFFGAVPPADAILVHHSLPATGGASGSPILDEQGRVVALLSAGNVLMRLAPSDAGGAVVERQPNAVLVNFGQRADLLQELRDGTAEREHARRAPQWQKQVTAFLQLRTAVEKARERLLASLRERGEAAGVGPPRVVGEMSSAGEAPDRGAVPAAPIEDGWEAWDVVLEKPGTYAIVAISTLADPIELRVVDSGGQKHPDPDDRRKRLRPGWAQVIFFGTKGTEPVRVEVARERGDFRVEVHHYAGS